MSRNVKPERYLAAEGAGGGYAGVFPVEIGDDAAAVLHRTANAADRHLLVLRFLLFNIAAFALLGAAWMRGWTAAVLKADDTGLSLGIFLVFLGGLALCGWRVFEISLEQEQARANHPAAGTRAAVHLAAVAGRDSGSRATAAARLKMMLASRISPVHHAANSLVLLGLIGTVVGFIIALSGVNPGTAGSVDAITPMVAELIHGMSVALYTTLVGAILHLWLKINYLILAGGATRLIDSLVARGEDNARL